MEDEADSTLQTKLAKAILKALGTKTMSEELLQLDSIRHQVKHQNMTPQNSAGSQATHLLLQAATSLATKAAKRCYKGFDSRFYTSQTS